MKRKASELEKNEDRDIGILDWIKNAIHAEDYEEGELEIEKAVNSEIIKKNLEKIGIQKLFPIQRKVIPMLLEDERRDICVASPTGSGKTLIYCIPIVYKLSQRLVPRLRGLIILPTKELVKQVQSVIRKLIIGSNIKVGVLPNEKNEVVDILISTPGRLVDYIETQAELTFQYLEFLVIDEADKLLNQSYQNWIPKIMQKLNKEQDEILQVGEWKQRNHRIAKKLLFSATLTRNPEKLFSLSLLKPLLVSNLENYETPETLDEYYIIVEAKHKLIVLLYILLLLKEKRVLCFTNSIETVQTLSRFLQNFKKDFVCESYNSEKSAEEKQVIIRKFKKNQIGILICSDAMARGIDIDDVQCVINYDTPPYLRNYIHRVGRTARAGKHGKSYTIVSNAEANHFKVAIKEKSKKGKLQKLSISEESFSTFKNISNEMLQSNSL